VVCWYLPSLSAVPLPHLPRRNLPTGPMVALLMTPPLWAALPLEHWRHYSQKFSTPFWPTVDRKLFEVFSFTVHAYPNLLLQMATQPPPPFCSSQRVVPAPFDAYCAGFSDLVRNFQSAGTRLNLPVTAWANVSVFLCPRRTGCFAFSQPLPKSFFSQVAPRPRRFAGDRPTCNVLRDPL